MHRNLSLPARLLDPITDGGIPPASGATNPPVSGGDPVNPPTNTNTDPGLRAEIDALKEQLSAQRPPSDQDVRAQVFENLRDQFVESGLSVEDAEVYAIATLTRKKGSGTQATTQQARQTAQQTPPSGGDPGDLGPSQEALEIQQLKAELVQLRQAVGRSETRSLTSMFNDQLKEVLDSAPELSNIMKRAGADNAAEIRTILLEDLDRTTRGLLQKRRDATHTWDNKWIGEEAKRAAALLQKRYRTVIADPSLLGPSETVAEADRFLATKPVEAPVYKPGMSLGDAQAASRSFASDQIARAIAEAAKASETSV